MRRPARPVDQAIDDRQQERRGLAASGLRAGDDVPSVERRWNRLGLDRRRPDEPEFFDRLDEGRIEFQVREAHT